MVRKKSKIILLSIIAILMVSAVSMFVYGCFCLNKKGSPSSPVNQTEAATATGEDYSEEDPTGAGVEMKWSPSDWAWKGNDDYGLPDRLPVPAVFMTTTYNFSVKTTPEGEYGGKITTGQKGSYTNSSKSVPVRFFKGTSLTVNGHTGDTISFGEDGAEKVCTAEAYYGYKFTGWTQSNTDIVANFEKLSHEVYYCSSCMTSADSHTCSWVTASSEVAYNGSIDNNDKIYGTNSFNLTYGKNNTDANGSFYYTSIAGGDPIIKTCTNPDGYYVSGWAYASVNKYSSDATLNPTSPTDFTQVEGNPSEVSVSYILGDVNEDDVNKEYRIYLRPVWTLKVYDITINIDEPYNSSDSSEDTPKHQNCGCTDCKGGYISNPNDQDKRDTTITISGVPHGSNVSSNGNTISIGANTVTVTALEGHSFSGYSYPSTISGETTITATFTPIAYTATAYYTNSPTESISTTEDVSYYVCGTYIGLPSVTITNKTDNDLGIFTTDSWKIGPFDKDGNYTLYKLNNAYYYSIKNGVFKDSAGNININFNIDGDRIYLNLYGETYDGYYYIVKGINSGSYGDLNTINGYPVITNYWEKIDNYLLYYNNNTKATFHETGLENGNGYNVNVKKDNGYIINDVDTYTNRSTITGNEVITVTTGTTGTIEYSNTKIEYKQDGYKVIGFRYKLIGLSTTLGTENTGSITLDTKNTDWKYSAELDGWGDEEDEIDFNNKSINDVLDEKIADYLVNEIYAIAVQPVMELITYTATFDIVCSKGGNHGGSFSDADESNNDNIRINERTTISTTYQSKIVSGVIEVEVSNLVKGITFEGTDDGDTGYMTFTYLKGKTGEKVVAKVNAINNKTSDEVALYELSSWSAGGSIGTSGVNITATFAPKTFKTTAYYANDGGVPTSDLGKKESESYFYCDTTDRGIADDIADIENGSEVIKYFDCWQIGPFNASNKFIHNNNYTAIIDKDNKILTFSGDEVRVRFNLKQEDPIIDINGYHYYLLKADKEIKGCLESNDLDQNGNYGNLTTITDLKTKAEKPVVTARWATVYDLTVLNDGGDDTIWSYVDVNDDNKTKPITENEDYKYLGVKGKVNGTEVNDSYQIGLKVDNRDAQANNYNFIVNQDFAFYTEDNTIVDTVGSVSNVSKLDTDNWFGVYNYGYVIKGWQISFGIDSETRYIRWDNDDDGWKYYTYNELTNQGLNSYMTVSDIIDNNLTIGGYANLLDNLYTAGLTEDIFLTIEPYWEAAKIDVYETCKESNLGERETYADPVKKGENIEFNKSYSLNPANAFTGTSFAIYKVEDTDIPITANSSDNQRVWNYYNIPQGKFTYENDVYKLKVTSYSVSNIYKITLGGIKVDDNFKLLTEGSSYTLNRTEYTQNFYTFSNTGYLPSGVYYWCNGYADTYKSCVDSYVSNIKSGSHDMQKKIYSTDINADGTLVSGKSSCNAYIFLAHGYAPETQGHAGEYPTGTLPAFDHMNDRLIYWYNSDAEVDDKESNIYHTSLFKATDRDPGYDDDANDRGNTTTWSYNGSNTTFTAHYFRKYYFINPEIVEEGKIDQVGYLIIDSVDKIEESDDINRYEGTYLAIALKANTTDTKYQMHYYLIKGYDEDDNFVDYTNDFTLDYITINGTVLTYNTNQLTECKEKGIKIYSGCSVNISIFDQSKDPLGMASENFDTMIGHKFMTASATEDTSGELYNGYDGSDYNRKITYEDSSSDPMGKALGYKNAESIKFTFEFEKIEYNLIFKIDNANAGNITITSPYGEYVGETNKQINDLKVGDAITFKYNASIGYDLKDNAVKFTVQSVNGSTKSYTFSFVEKKATDGFVEQVFSFVIDGTWLRENYYCKDQSTGNEGFLLTDNIADDNDGVDLGIMQVNTEMIEFDYKIKLIDSEGNNTGEISVGKWNISAKTLSFSSVISDSGNEYGYVINFNNVDYAMIQSYFERFNGRTTLVNRKYSFPVKNDPTADFNIVSNLENIFNYKTTIIPTNNRIITGVIVVEPICKLEIESYSNDYFAPISMTVSNQSNNLILNSLEYSKTTDTTTNITIYTYKGLENSIRINNFDTVAYKGVTFNNDDTIYAIGDTYKFTVSEDKIVTFKMVEADHKYNIKYYVDGKMVASRPDDLLVETDSADVVVNSSTGDGYVRLNDTIKLNYKSNNAKYVLTARIPNYESGTIHQVNPNTGTIDEIKIVSEYLNATYEFDICICLDEVANDNIRIFLLLESKAQERDGDNLGTFSVKVDNASVVQNVNSALVKVYEGKSLSVDLSLNKGYVYSGKYQINSTTPTAKSLEGNTLKITDNYVIPSSSNTYYILINKVENEVQFSNSREGNYSYNVENSQDNRHVIVGDRISLYQHTNTSTERFVRYYYGSAKTTISENPNTTFTVLEDMLEGDKLIIGVETEDYCKVKVEMDNESQKMLKEFNASVMDQTLSLNRESYVVIGDINIKLSANVKDKYNYYYKINNGTEKTIQENQGVASLILDMKDIIGDIARYDLNAGIVVTLRIEPKEFSQYKLTENWDGIEKYNGMLASADNDIIISDPRVSSCRYGDSSTIELVYKNDNYILTSITLKGNDSEDVTVTIDKNASKVEVAGYNIVVDKTNNKVIINYTVSNNIELILNYTKLINIMPDINIQP